jgi:putative transposase
MSTSDQPSFGVRHRDAALESADTSAHSKHWPHAPVHRLDGRGAYMVTSGTYQKIHYLNTPERLDQVTQRLFDCNDEFSWELHAWAVLSNHYHFVARPGGDPRSLRRVMAKLHMTTSKILNQLDKTPGRRVWFQYWDSHITFERSYLARLNYVHRNPVHHGVVTEATAYPWCSASWFERVAPAAFVKTVNTFKTDQVQLHDDF